MRATVLVRVLQRLLVITLLYSGMTACGQHINHQTVPALAGASAGADWWQPKADQNLRWYWQLQGEVIATHEVEVYDIDIDAPQAVIDTLKSRGVKLICYFSVGTVELFRDDANQFPQRAIGQAYPGYEDERWLDLSNYQLFADIMRARLDRCAAKGFDGVEGDNVDAFNQAIPDDNNIVQQGTSFGITEKQSAEYVLWLAAESHKRGLAFGLKNAEALAPAVIDQVDWIITENCFVDGWCDDVKLFVENNKPVFMTEYVEYTSDFTSACRLANSLRYSAIYRDAGLTATGVFKECN